MSELVYSFHKFVKNLICRVLSTYMFTRVHLVLSSVQSRSKYLPSMSERLSVSVKDIVAISTPFYFAGPEALNI